MSDDAKKTELLYRQLFHQSNDGFVIHQIGEAGPEKTLDVSNGTLDMLGYTREEFLALPPLDSQDEFPEENMVRVVEEIQDKGFAEYQTRLIAKDGRKIPVEMFVSFPEKNISLARARDITDRITTRKIRKLRAEIWQTVADKSLSEFELVQKLLTKIISVIDIHRATVFQLDEEKNIYRSLSTQSRQEFFTSINLDIPFEIAKIFFGREVIRIPQDLTEAPGEIKDAFLGMLDKTNVKSTLIVSFGQNVTRPDSFIAYSNCERVRDWGDEAIFAEMTKIILNRIKEIRSDRALVEEREHFYDMIDKSPESILVVDNQGQVLFFNKRAEESTGYSRDEMMGKIAFDSNLFPEETLELALDKFENQLLNGEEVIDFELIFKHKNGNPIVTEVNAIPMKDNFLITARVITDKKQMENALKESQLREKILTESNEGILNWMNIMAHELKTPLNAVSGFSTLGLRKLSTLEPENIKKFFSNISQASDTMLQLVNDLLDLAKMERGQMSYNMHRFDLKAILDNSRSIIDGLLLEKDLVLTVPEADFDMTLECDANRIGQVFLNLLSNSIKYNSKGKSIEVRFEQDEITLGRRLTDMRIPGIKFSISDEGMGIPGDQLAFIFDKFTQSRASDVRKGTGLGLSICREIVRAHQGTITVESEEGKGTTFSVVLPYEQRRKIDDL